jgi:hypothetical protein
MKFRGRRCSVLFGVPVKAKPDNTLAVVVWVTASPPEDLEREMV